jgi:hypothetical protein
LAYRFTWKEINKHKPKPNKMKKHLSIILTIIGSMLLNTATAQNVTIDYQTWNPSSPPCNIFGTAINVPAIVNGTNSTIEHQSLIGQPQLNASPKEIRLACKYVSASSSLGTKYRIAYNFKVGYKYIITINATELNSTTGYSTGPWLRLDMTNTSGGGGTCVGAQTISPNYSGNPAPYQFNDANFNDRQFAYSSPLTASYSTLEISALCCRNRK